MNPITFKGYGVRGGEVVVIAERITHFYPIDYNGNHGTCIVLDTDKEVNVSNWPSEVRMAIEQAGSPK
ncbi:hypothetical protein UFOVP1095_19 [uncultured Caudovirales phage]|uniref:Uncharacterized protein n=1 Tax=uncultured Caudovirales phage TaxID=2100421 RepID=A0A6J5PN65_9CAUD|nr:hypothetical protein UFOVP918_19 [uncultured Caudovirales phage]CAB4182409.1 hypothetical protein UFOVP1095_19 [uncultured Caudovirales phage]CAB4214002.1 hypothetical protein UFOVP1452_19 [uncultured Caudovirales phage]CAB5228432.1 hypothetical protein UFOVP1540_48 [uncultured Caudovirales phage]